MGDKKAYLVREAGGTITSNWYILWFSDRDEGFAAPPPSGILPYLYTSIREGYSVFFKLEDVPDKILQKRASTRRLNKKDIAELLASDPRARDLLGDYSEGSCSSS